MNVANLLATGTAGIDSSALNGGKNAAVDPGLLGALFAMQMENALGQVQVTSVVPELKGEGDFSNLQDLLAMLQQMLSGSVIVGGQPQISADSASSQTVESSQSAEPDTQPVLVTFTPVSQTETLDPSLVKPNPAQQETAKEFRQLVDFFSGLVPKQPNEITLDSQSAKPLIATFMQNGLSQQEATKFVQSLVTFAQAGEQAKQPEVHAAAEQISQLLSQLGVKTTDGKELTPKKDGRTFETVFKRTLIEIPQTQQIKLQPTQAVQTNLQFLKINKALSSYQVESGVTSRAQLNSSAQTPVNVQPMGVSAEQKSDVETFSVAVPQQQTAPLHAAPANQTSAQANTYTVRADQFSHQVTDLFVKQLKVGTLKGLTEAKLILHPQSLGQVDVKITSHNGMITAQFSVDNQAGKEMLDNQLSQLRNALTQQGLQVDRLEVTQQQASQQQFDLQQQKDQNKQQSFNRQQENKKNDDNEAVFSIDQLVEGENSISSLWNRARLAGNVNFSA